MAYDEENQYEETFEDGVRKVTNWLSKNLSGIFASLISLFFIFQGVVDVLPTTMGIKEQIITAFINIFAGFSITSLVGEYGFTSAKNSKYFIKVREEYNNSVKGALKYREAIEEMAKKRALDNLRDARVHILESANIYYGDVFNSDGSLNTNFDITKYKSDKQYLTKLRAYNKAVRKKIVKPNVFGMASSSTFGLKKEISEKEYRTRKGAKSIIFKVLLGVSSVGIMFVFVGWSWGAIIYAFMQIVLWVGCGLIERQKNYNFVYNELVQQMEDRTNIIEEFMKLSDDEKETLLKIAKANKQPIKQITFNENHLNNE